MKRFRRHTFRSGLAALLLAAATPAGAEYPDWQAVADVDVIEVLTVDEDGDPRETKVWFVLLEGEPYLRTNGSRWLDNLRRDPDLRLRIGDREYEALVEEVTGDAIIERVDDATAEKYGWQERFIHVFRMGKPEILKLSARD
jgi:hypothetical protein